MSAASQRVHDQFQGFLEYSQSISSLWMHYVNTNVEQTHRLTDSLMQLNQALLSPPVDTVQAATDYSLDFIQRNILFWNVLRERGNQYLKHVDDGQPPVLIFSYKTLIDGREFAKPVNYALVEIIPPAGIKIDPCKRPYVIVDPRAGHGAGISGFKDESQVGVALRAGHPVYVVIFFPIPEPDQTLVDVTTAHEKFLIEVALRHPHSPKPCIIGNCQGGWAVSTLMAAHPDIAGVTVINGAPLSYWGGENGKNPMRYIGGILGGSWLAQLAGDLGNGKFDGANLVMNFEIANPQVTYWKKYYNLFANIDKEETRFLEFERWWGGFSLLNVNEMRGIVDNLFIGNKLVHGKIPLGESGNNCSLAGLTTWVRANRVQVSKNNPYLTQQSYFSNFIHSLWEYVTVHRDNLAEILFYAMYGYIQQLTPFDPKRDRIVHFNAENYKAKLTKFINEQSMDGSIPDAIIRTLLLLSKSQGYFIATNYPNVVKTLRNCKEFSHLDDDDIKQIVRTQTIIIEHDPELALSSLPKLLSTREEALTALAIIDEIIASLEIPPAEKYKVQYQKIKQILFF